MQEVGITLPLRFIDNLIQTYKTENNWVIGKFTQLRDSLNSTHSIVTKVNRHARF